VKKKKKSQTDFLIYQHVPFINICHRMSSDIKMDFGETKYETVKLTEMAEKVEEFWSFEYAGGDLSTSTG